METATLEEVLATVHALLRAEGMEEAADLVRGYSARAERTGYDNWNGGTEIWDVYFDVPAQRRSSPTLDPSERSSKSK